MADERRHKKVSSPGSEIDMWVRRHCAECENYHYELCRSPTTLKLYLICSACGRTAGDVHVIDVGTMNRA